MPTKEELEQQNVDLLAENELLRAQLAATPAAGAPNVAQHRFQLSEGERQDLVANGVVNKDGRAMTREDVEAELGEDQQNVDLGDAEPPAGFRRPADRSAIRGVDYVWPSVEPGKIDPAVAGTPGINGPSA